MKQRGCIMKSISLCIGDLKRLVKTPKIYLLMLLTWFFLDNFVMDIKNIAVSAGIGITPFVYPVFMSEWHGRMLGLLIMVLLMSDAPFYNGNEKNVFTRVSKYGWILSKILYVVCLSFMYQLFVFVASIVVCAPYIAISNQWGTAIETYARGLAGGIQAGVSGGMYGVISNYNPIEALLMEVLISFLICVIVGMIVMCFNILFDGYVGTIVASVFVVLDAFLESFYEPAIDKLLAKLPIVWVSLSGFIEGNVSYSSACKNSIVIILVLIILILAITNMKMQKIRER